MLLGSAIGADDLRAHLPAAIAKLRRARAVPDEPVHPVEDDATDALIVTDGHTRWQAMATIVPGEEILLAFTTDLPPANTALTIVQTPVFRRAEPERPTICFTPGTLIDTPNGQEPIEALLPGDKVLTRDDGPQEVLWSGLRHISGARLYALPGLRPVCIRSGALGGGEPDPDLRVSPDHHVLLTGPKAQTLWNTDEILVRARDLIDDCGIIRDHSATEIVYIHLLFARHQVIRANGVWVESFHPDDADLSHLTPIDLEALREVAPGPSYGPYARRCLSTAELAILRHDGAPRHLA